MWILVGWLATVSRCRADIYGVLAAITQSSSFEVDPIGVRPGGNRSQLFQLLTLKA